MITVSNVGPTADCTVLMAAFNENGWMPGGHAVRMAVDMGINRSFVALLRSGMGKGKSPEELEEERHLVVQSRVWFCVSLQRITYLIGKKMADDIAIPRRASNGIWNGSTGHPKGRRIYTSMSSPPRTSTVHHVGRPSRLDR